MGTIMKISISSRERLPHSLITAELPEPNIISGANYIEPCSNIDCQREQRET